MYEMPYTLEEYKNTSYARKEKGSHIYFDV